MFIKIATFVVFGIILCAASFSVSQEIDAGIDGNSEAALSARDTAPEPALLPETRVESPAPAVPTPTTRQRNSAPESPSLKATPSGSPPPNPAAVPTVIATKTPKVEVPSTEVSAVSELKQYQRFSVNDTLRQMPGTTIIQNGGPGTLTGFNIRGMQSDQNVVLLNGRRLPPGLAGQHQLEFLEVSTLESVQVLRGSASSLYGADAIGGVIDLRSTDARFVENNGLSLYSEGGSFHTFRSGGIASFRDGRIGGVLETATIQTEADRPSSDFENQTFRGDIAFDVADGIWFDVLGFVQSGEVRVPGSSFQNPAFPEAQKNFNDSYLISPRLTVESDQWDFSLFYSYNQNDLEALDTLRFFGFGTDGSLRQIGRETEAVFSYDGMDHAVLSIGGGSYTYQFLQEPIGINSFVVPASREHRYDSIFGQADLQLPGHINLVSSVRNDTHDSYDDATTYSIAINKKFPGTGTNVFTKVATGYRAPTGQDLLFIVDPSGINPADIAPEESLSREAGIRQTLFQNRASVTATYFHNDFSNSIEFDPTTFGLSTVDGETKGFEFEGRFSPGKRVTTYTNYTYLDTEVTGGAGNLSGRPGERLPRRPRHTLNAGLVFSGDNWDLGAEIHGAIDRFDRSAAPRFADDYLVTRLFGSYDLNERVELYGRIENLFDEDYIYTRGFEAPGFGAFTGLRVLLGK